MSEPEDPSSLLPGPTDGHWQGDDEILVDPFAEPVTVSTGCCGSRQGRVVPYPDRRPHPKGLS